MSQVLFATDVPGCLFGHVTVREVAWTALEPKAAQEAAGARDRLKGTQEKVTKSWRPPYVDTYPFKL